MIDGLASRRAGNDLLPHDGSGAAPSGPLPGRLVNKLDFERLLAARSSARSDHFAVHHLLSRPAMSAKLPPRRPQTKLSTSPAPACPQLVDDSSEAALVGRWLGCVVPKRFARRAVTRNLVKRHARAVFAAHMQQLPAGLWLVRLRAPFATAQFPSARSAALAAAVRNELQRVLGRLSS